MVRRPFTIWTRGFGGLFWRTIKGRGPARRSLKGNGKGRAGLPIVTALLPLAPVVRKGPRPVQRVNGRGSRDDMLKSLNPFVAQPLAHFTGPVARQLELHVYDSGN